MYALTDDLRILSVRPLVPPAILMEEVPVSEASYRNIEEARATISNILHGYDDRLVVIVGPCSVHDPAAAREYATRLRAQAAALSSQLFIVMRTYFEKPRTTVGWKGLINDPHLDGSFQINRGLRIAREFLRDVAELGLPAATEFLDPISPQFVADLVSWGAIGARTTESQVHREMASGLSMPVGFKNGTNGGVRIAMDAIRSSSHPHHFLGVTKQGISAIVATRGNRDCHLILRGGNDGPNYSAAHVAEVAEQLQRDGLEPRVMIDCSHGNSSKDHRRQPLVAKDIAEQLQNGSRSVFGVMLESNLVAGRQDHAEGSELTYGQSITDACIGWDDTVPVLEELAEAVERRRQKFESAARAMAQPDL